MAPDTLFRNAAGILLAGTHPWTNSVFDSLLPRTLLPVAHRPLIWYGLSWLRREGIREVAVCGNRKTRLLEARLVRHTPDDMSLSYHEDPMPRGAAGSARDAALATEATTFVIADGTAIPNVDLRHLVEHHTASGACITVVVHTESTGSGSPAIHVPSGIYVFDRRAFETVPERGFSDIKERLIPALRAAGERVVAYEAVEPTPRVLDAQTYMAVNEWMVERLVCSDEPLDGYERRGGLLVHVDANIDADATLVGPVLVGPEARVMGGAVVVGPASIGREATIAGLVSRSAVWRRSVVAESGAVDRCIVADDAVIEAGRHVFRDVVAIDGRSLAEADWVAQKPVAIARMPVLEVAARLGRMAFGGSRMRSASQ